LGRKGLHVMVVYVDVSVTIIARLEVLLSFSACIRLSETCLFIAGSRGFLTSRALRRFTNLRQVTVLQIQF
jgi:hypothetical protein